MTLPKTDIQRPSPEELLEERILLLDGGFGTMVQGYGLAEEDFRGERFRGWEVQLKGCNDLLAVTRPDVVREIHEKYLRAGADIIETDSFNANAVSLADYRLVQTPQTFDIQLLKRAYAQPYQDGFTDDASVVESAGQAITMIEGNRENIKITTPFDLRIARVLA